MKKPTKVYRSARGGNLLTVLVLLAALLVALLLGSAGALVGWFGQVLLLSVVLPLTLLLVDYRIGLVVLILLVPFANARFIPKAGPLSIINVVLLGVILVFALRYVLDRMAGKEMSLPVPKEIVVFFILPVTFGFAIGSFHLGEIPAHAIAREDDRVGTISYYWISLYLKNFLMYMVAFLIAASIIKHKDYWKYVKFMILSATLFVFGGVAAFVVSGNSLEAAVRSRQMYSPLGLHANEVSGMLLPVLGVVLFLRDELQSMFQKSLLIFVIVVLFGGILLTGSRAGFLGLIVVSGYYVLRNRRFGAAGMVIFLGLLGLFFAPAAITDRLFMGLDVAFGDAGRHDIGAADEQLTSGRFFIYSQLLPDFFRSPIFGNGITSTLWSTYVRGGGMIGHPHNMYIAILLDMGLLGILLIGCYFWYVWKIFTILSVSPAVPKEMRAFFAGCAAGFLGFLTRGLAGGDIYPNMEIWFFVVGLGIAIGCHRLYLNEHMLSKSASNHSGDAARLGPGLPFWR